MPAPQATLIAMIAEGVIVGNLPYALVGVGVMIGVLMALLRIPILPFALGIYLPLSLSTGTMCGGLVKAYVNRRNDSAAFQQQGTLLSAGLIGGDACTGVLVALLTVAGIIPLEAPTLLPPISSVFAYLLLACFLAYFSCRKGSAVKL